MSDQQSPSHPPQPDTPLNAPRPEALGVSGPDTPAAPGQEQEPARLPGWKNRFLPWFMGLAVMGGLFLVLWLFSD